MIKNNDIKAKGLYLGKCGTSYCSTPLAKWFNHSSRIYLCAQCAIITNQANSSEAGHRFGHTLCTEGEVLIRTV